MCLIDVIRVTPNSIFERKSLCHGMCSQHPGTLLECFFGLKEEEGIDGDPGGSVPSIEMLETQAARAVEQAEQCGVFKLKSSENPLIKISLCGKL